MRGCAHSRWQVLQVLRNLELFGDRLPGPAPDPDSVAGTLVSECAVRRHDHVDSVVVACDLAAFDHDRPGHRDVVPSDIQREAETITEGTVISADTWVVGAAAIGQELTDLRLVVGLIPRCVSDSSAAPREQSDRLLVGHERRGVERHGVHGFERPLVVGDDELHAVREVIPEQLLQVVLLRDQPASGEPVGVLGESTPDARADDDLGQVAEHEVHAKLVRFTHLHQFPGDEVDERFLQRLLQVALNCHDDLEAVVAPEPPAQLGEKRGWMLGSQMPGAPIAEHVDQRLLHLVGERGTGGHAGDDGTGLSRRHGRITPLWMCVACNSSR